MATIGAANDPLSFVLTIPDEDTPAVPFSGMFTPMANSFLAALVRLKKQVQSMQNFSDAVTGVSGWQITYQNLIIFGENIGMLHLTLQKTGSALTVPSNGNIGNVTVAQFKAGYEPQGECQFGGGDTGRNLSAYGLSDGTIRLASMNNGYDVAVNDSISLIGTFVLNNPVRSSI